MVVAAVAVAVSAGEAATTRDRRRTMAAARWQWVASMTCLVEATSRTPTTHDRVMMMAGRSFMGLVATEQSRSRLDGGRIGWIWASWLQIRLWTSKEEVFLWVCHRR